MEKIVINYKVNKKWTFNDVFLNQVELVEKLNQLIDRQNKMEEAVRYLAPSEYESEINNILEE